MDGDAAIALGRLWWRWTVYRVTYEVPPPPPHIGRIRVASWARVSHHWTRRGAEAATSVLHEKSGAVA